MVEKPFTSYSNVLDAVLLRALASQGFTHPTPIQARVMQAALQEPKDILARSRTGSGKTLAYGICLVQAILRAKTALKATDPDYNAIRSLVLVPTKELAQQVAGHLRSLGEALGDDQLVRVVNIAAGDVSGKKAKSNQGFKIQKSQLADKPDIVVSTPSRCLMHLRQASFTLSQLDALVIDEADLILSYGHSADDIASILNGPWEVPVLYRRFLMSATITGEVEQLQGIVLRDPAMIIMKDEEDALASLSQYAVRCTEFDKFLLLYVLLKLKLVKGKILLFVNDIDRGYRLKLFLERFGMRSGVLNAELPFNSRFHAVQEFNRGVFNYLIATDDAKMDVQLDKDAEEAEQTISTQTHEAGEEPVASTSKSSKRKRKQGTGDANTEYGVSRGIDFVDVACVLNFDMPTSARAYTHRIGRTARAGKEGMALSFVVPKASLDQPNKWDVTLPTSKLDERTWRKVEKDQAAKGGSIKEYKFDMKMVEGFRYRTEDALRAVTKAVVREARIKEIKQEVLNSEKLKAHFEENPRDYEYLRHDKPLHTMRSQPHLKHVPSYLMPKIASVSKAAVNAEVSTSAAPASESKVSFRKNKNSMRGNKKGNASRGPKIDPLKKFTSKRR